MYLGKSAMTVTKLKSLIQRIIGWILTVFFGLGVILYATDPADRADLPFAIGCFCVSAIPLVLGYRNKHKMTLAKRYNLIFEADEDGILTLEQLSVQSGKEKRVVEQEVGMLIEKGFLNECTLRKGSVTTVILSGKKKKTKESVFRTFTCPNCGAAVTVREGVRTQCSYCGTYFQG